jgi:hypothetical protein
MYFLSLYICSKCIHIYSCLFHKMDTTTDIALWYLRSGHEYIEKDIRVYEF